MTLGIVQKGIRIGITQADVAASLGSPNIVARDSAEAETWIYDKILRKSPTRGTRAVRESSRC
jgi:hypothetical protein